MRDARRSAWIPLALSALAIAIRAGVATTNHRTLVAAGIFQDDAFYYLTIARNWANGLGPSFDGVTATNAFHPMLMAFEIPIVSFSGDDLAAPIHAVGLLLALFAGGSTWLAYAIVRDWAVDADDSRSEPISRWAAATAAALVAVSPYFVVHSVNGQETGLAIFFGLALVRAEQCWLRSPRSTGWLRASAFGALAAMGILARIDAALLVAAIGAMWMVRAARQHVLGETAARALLAAAVAVALWLPWGAFSKAATGAWLPTSGAASREIALNLGWVNLRPIFAPERAEAGRLFDPGNAPSAWYADIASEQLFVMLLEQPLLAALRVTDPFAVWPALERYAPYPVFVAHPLVSVGALCILFALLAWAMSRVPAKPGADTPSQTSTVWLYALVTFGAYTFHSPSHWSFPRYACLPTMLLMLVGLAGCARALTVSGTRPVRIAAALLAATLVAFQLFQLGSFERVRLRANQAGGFLEAWDSLGPKVPSGATIGAFQAGIYGWFGDRPIVNLDGKVNTDAQRALASGRLYEYIASHDIDYLLDWQLMVYALFARHTPDEAGIGLREVARQKAPTPVVLYRVTRTSRP